MICNDLQSKSGRRVLSVDVVGRGRSSFLQKGDVDGYGYSQYCTDMISLLRKETVGHQTVDWIGTSMGGLIGLTLASSLLNPARLVSSVPIDCSNLPRFRRMVINDIGPFVPREGLSRLLDYVTNHPPSFPNLASLNDYLRKSYRPFGPLTDKEWMHMTLSTAVLDKDFCEEGGNQLLLDDPLLSKSDPNEPLAVRLHFDPCLSRNLAFSNDIDLVSAIWEPIPKHTENGPEVMLIRGMLSDLLTPSTVELMRSSGPGLAHFVEFEGIGHAPALFDPIQVSEIVKFLNSS